MAPQLLAMSPRKTMMPKYFHAEQDLSPPLSLSLLTLCPAEEIIEMCVCVRGEDLRETQDR